MTKLHIVGFSGRMGQLVKLHSLKDLGIILEPSLLEADLIIDFSHHESIEQLLKLKDELKNKAIVVGTTGAVDFDEYQNSLKTVASNNKVFYSANMSIGIYLMRQFVELCYPFYKDADILISDIHHKHKKDSPSGTSKMLGKDIEAQYSSVRFAEKFGTHSVLIEDENEKLEIMHESKNRDIFAVNALKIGKWLLKQQNGFYEMKNFVGGFINE